MRTSKTPAVQGGFRARLLALAVGAFAVAASPLGVSAQDFSSADDAQQQGISAYKGGYYDLAIPPLQFAAQENLLLAQFYLGELFADNNSPHTDHAKAYVLYQTIANNYADVDPGDRSKAPFVARALTSLARYLTRGIPEIGVTRDTTRAAEYLHHAAIFFNDEDAQFELAKLYLKGEGVPIDVAKGKHWLATLAKKGHASAQAFLADLLWRGKIVRRNPVQSLALISVAVKNAPPRDRVWIEDIYQNIYCGASKGVRTQVDFGMVAKWDKRYGRKPAIENRHGLGLLNVETQRLCHDGRTLPLLEQQHERATPANERHGSAISADAGAKAGNGGSEDGAGDIVTGSTRAGTKPPPNGFAHGSALGFTGSGLRNVGKQDFPTSAP